jgi:hypothetical protein
MYAGFGRRGGRETIELLDDIESQADEFTTLMKSARKRPELWFRKRRQNYL